MLYDINLNVSTGRLARNGSIYLVSNRTSQIYWTEWMEKIQFFVKYETVNNDRQ